MSPIVAAAPSAVLRQAGMVAVAHAVAVPHFGVVPSHQLAVYVFNPTAVAALVPQRHWHIPRFAIAVNVLGHVTPAQGS